jgi:hypothetical protein
MVGWRPPAPREVKGAEYQKIRQEAIMYYAKNPTPAVKPPPRPPASSIAANIAEAGQASIQVMRMPHESKIRAQYEAEKNAYYKSIAPARGPLFTPYGVWRQNWERRYRRQLAARQAARPTTTPAITASMIAARQRAEASPMQGFGADTFSIRNWQDWHGQIREEPLSPYYARQTGTTE